MKPSEQRTEAVSAGTRNDGNGHATLGSLKKIIPLYALSFLLLATVVVGFIWHDLRAEYLDTLAYWNVQLSGSADDRVRISGLWLNERRTDTMAVAESSGTIHLLTAGVSRSEVAAVRRGVEHGLGHIASDNGFLGGAIGDRNCRIVAQTGLRPEMAQGLREACQEVQEAGEYRVAAFGMEQGHVWLSLSAPVRAEDRATSSAPPTRRIVGAVVMVTENWRDIVPIFASVSVPKMASETFVVWKKSGEAFIFSPLFKARGVPSLFRRPLNGGSFESRVALAGDVAFAEFTNYRGQPVFGVARQIGVPGYSLAREVHRDEALADYHRHRVLDGLVGTLALLLLGSVMVAQHRHTAARDFAERVKQQEALRQSEAKLREALLAAQMGVWEWAVGTNTVTWDENLYRIAGRDPRLAAPNYEEQAQIFAPQSWERLKAAVENTLATGTPYELDLELVRPDGSKRWLIGRGEPLRDASGQITRLRGTVQDITERKRADTALQESDERLRGLFENATVGIYRTTPTGQILVANPALVKMLGYKRLDELVQRNLEEQGFEPTNPRQIFHERMAQDGEVKGLEGVWRKQDGSVIFVRESARAIQGKDNQILYYDGFVEDITERKRAEMAVRASDQRYKDFISHSHEGVWRVDLDQPIPINLPEEEMLERILRYGYIAECNSALARTFGFSSPEEVTGLRLRDLISSSDQERLESFRSSVRGRLGSRTVELRGRDKAGNLKHLLRTEIPIVENGMLVNIWGITRDITELKRAEEASRENEERFRATFENAGVGMALVDMQGHPIKSNPALRQMLGYSEEELSRMAFTEFTHPEDRELDWGLYSELAAGKRDKYEIEKRYLKKGGGVVWGLLTVSLVKDRHGCPVYAVGMVQDITERKRAEEALRQSEQRYRDFIEHSHEGVWRVDLDQPIPINLPDEEILERIMQYGYVAECNLALAHILGFTTAIEPIGARIRDLFPASDQERVESLRSSVQSGLRSGTVEIRGLDKAGNRQHLLRTQIPIVEKGMLVNVWGITRNITELKRAEEDLQRSLDQLRALAGRLQSIREEERKRLARDIHDQLGQALTAIKIDLSSLAQELPEGEEPQLKRASSLLKLVEESIRTVRRIATELRPGMLDDLGLVATIEWAGEDFQVRTGTACRLDLPPDDMAIDPERATAIFRIFQETLTNVARHADASEVKVRLAREDGELTLEVHDNGRGISEDILASGQWLGILGMRERAMLLGGELTISGAPENGTTVKVRIPEAPRT